MAEEYVDDAELSHAVEALEATASRAGLDVGAEPDRPAEAVAAPTAPTPVAELPLTSTPEPPAESRIDPHAEFNSRRAQREERLRMQAQQDLLDRLARQLETSTQAAAQQAAPAAAEDDDPEPDMVNEFPAWQDWKGRQVEKRILSQFQEKLGPVTSFFEQQQREAEARAEAARDAQQRQAWMREQAQHAREASEVYAQHPDAQGFPERLMWFAGAPADPASNQPAIDGTEAIGLMRAGLPPDLARGLARAHLQGLQVVALNNNLNPAQVVDAVIRTYVEQAGLFYGAGQQQGYQQPYQQTAQPTQQQPRRDPEIARLQQTARQAQGVAGTAAAARAGDSTQDIASLLQDGNITPQKIRQIAAHRYGSASPANIARVNQEMTAHIERLRAAG